MLLSINNQSFVVKLCDQVRFVLLQAEPFSLLFFFSLLIVSLLFLDALCYGSSVLKWLRRQFVLCGFSPRSPPFFLGNFLVLYLLQESRDLLSLSLSLVFSRGCTFGSAKETRNKNPSLEVVSFLEQGVRYLSHLLRCLFLLYRCWDSCLLGAPLVSHGHNSRPLPESAELPGVLCCQSILPLFQVFLFEVSCFAGYLGRSDCIITS